MLRFCCIESDAKLSFASVSKFFTLRWSHFSNIIPYKYYSKITRTLRNVFPQRLHFQIQTKIFKCNFQFSFWSISKCIFAWFGLLVPFWILLLFNYLVDFQGQCVVRLLYSLARNRRLLCIQWKFTHMRFCAAKFLVPLLGVSLSFILDNYSVSLNKVLYTSKACVIVWILFFFQPNLQILSRRKYCCDKCVHFESVDFFNQ